MAFGSGYLSGDETTQRESLLDTITVRSPAETPLLRQLPRFDMPNRVHEWSIDEPFKSTENARSPGSPHENSRLEAAEFSYRTAFYPTRLKTIAEINHFGMEISNTDRTVVAAGMPSTTGYRSGQLFALLLNNMETIGMYGTGSPETDGSGTDERRTQGLIYNAAWTGLERSSGSTADSIPDPYGVRIPSAFWSVFYDANHSNLTRSMLYGNVIVPLLNAGARLDTPWVFHAGYKTMQAIASFLTDASGNSINDRNIDASAGGGYDFISWLKVPSGHTVGFRTNRYLSLAGQTYSVDNANYTPGSPSSPGSVGSKTFQGDETIIGWEPGTVSIGFVRPPHFMKVETTGDYTRTAAIAEFAIRVKHPLCIAGIGNCVA